MIPTDLEKNFTSFLSYNAPILTGLDTPVLFPPENHEIYMVLLEHIHTAYARQKNCKLKKSQNKRFIKILRKKPKMEILKTPFFLSSSFPSTLANCSLSKG